MPKGPKGQKRPADVIGNAVKIAQIATGEVEDEAEDDGKDSAAKALGSKGGKARALKLNEKERSGVWLIRKVRTCQECWVQPVSNQLAHPVAIPGLDGLTEGGERVGA